MLSTKYNQGDERDYCDIQDHGLIGNLHTAAMVSGAPTLAGLANARPF